MKINLSLTIYYWLSKLVPFLTNLRQLFGNCPPATKYIYTYNECLLSVFVCGVVLVLVLPVWDWVPAWIHSDLLLHTHPPSFFVKLYSPKQYASPLCTKVAVTHQQYTSVCVLTETITLRYHRGHSSKHRHRYINISLQDNATWVICYNRNHHAITTIPTIIPYRYGKTYSLLPRDLLFIGKCYCLSLAGFAITWWTCWLLNPNISRSIMVDVNPIGKAIDRLERTMTGDLSRMFFLFSY